jgi:hypothetical protein
MISAAVWPVTAQWSLFCTVLKNVCLEERLRHRRRRVVVDAALLVDVGNLQVEPPLARPNLADAIEQLVEVVFPKPLVQLESLIVKHKPLDDKFPQRPRRPNAKLRRLRAVDAVADRDDGVEVVEVDFAGNLPFSLGLNSPDFPESCPFRQLARLVNVAQMLTYRPHIDPKQLRNLLLIQPKSLRLIQHLDPHRPRGCLVQNQIPFAGRVFGRHGGLRSFRPHRKHRAISMRPYYRLHPEAVQ